MSPLILYDSKEGNGKEKFKSMKLFPHMQIVHTFFYQMCLSGTPVSFLFFTLKWSHSPTPC